MTKLGASWAEKHLKGNKLDEKERKVALYLRKRVSCPVCQHTITGLSALNKGISLGEYEVNDFTCPDCRTPLMLKKPLFGGSFYFASNVYKPNFDNSERDNIRKKDE